MRSSGGGGLSSSSGSCQLCQLVWAGRAMVWASVWAIVGCIGVGSRGSRSCRVASQGVARWEVGWETASGSHEIQSLKQKRPYCRTPTMNFIGGKASLEY